MTPEALRLRRVRVAVASARLRAVAGILNARAWNQAKRDLDPSKRVDDIAEEASPALARTLRKALVPIGRAFLTSAGPKEAMKAVEMAFEAWNPEAVADAIERPLQRAAAAGTVFAGIEPLRNARAKPGLSAKFFSADEAAAALIAGKRAVTRKVFDGLLPELRARAFTVSGLTNLDQIARLRKTVEDYARGQTTTGEAVTWDDAKELIMTELGWGDDDESHRRATLLLRTHGFQAYQSATWRTSQDDPDTTHLQYMTMEDEKVRDSHRALDGLVLPKGDPFWDKHLPPWDWGCRCSVRPINPDLLDIERDRDLTRAPEDRNVVDGPVADQLRHGTLMRGGQRYDVTPPSDGPQGDKAWKWHPDDLRLPIRDILQRYDQADQDTFTAWAKRTLIAPLTTLWSHLNP